MREAEYQIGDVAKIVGLSCDALRFYEKKGIIKARKKENGYRCYSQEDLYKLMYIVYHRKMNASLEEIDGILGKDVKEGLLKDHVMHRLKEEEEELRRHYQAIARLRLVAQDLDSIENSLGNFSFQNFPEGYVVDRCDSQEDGVKEWFRISAGESGLDMTYFYNVFSYSEEEGLSHKETQMIVYKKVADCLNLKEAGENLICRTTEKRPCIYCVIRSEHVCPEKELVEQMREWAISQGDKPQETVYVNAMMTVFIGEKLNHYLEIYIPALTGQED
ncbi:MAG TPA: MerR family transcriptional regulator [Candidatus Enterocloster faecavium]|uniref:MerR family transcriptional regulator n=1 Tax=Candidatus Enterocloster faecavium TaxID=2838560 RepID=A0A9D2RMS0_9FIRM|nr:MerR family transcriptional regulator [Candidatus Enterocloster faecavium]